MPETVRSTDSIPGNLKMHDQWVVWRLECRDCGETQFMPSAGKECEFECGGEKTKVPYQSKHPDKKAKSNDPSTWSPFEDAVGTYKEHEDIAGIGIVLCSDDDLVGFDIDDVRNPSKDELEPYVWEIVAKSETYFEISPSGTGLRGFMVGQLTDGRRRRNGVEMYDEGRYLTVTGNVFELSEDSLNENQEALEEIHQDYLENGQNEEEKQSDWTNEFGVSLAKYRAEDEKLDMVLSDLEPSYPLSGDDNTKSGYDLALVSKLHFYRFSKSDAKQILKDFRYRKKLERDDYVERTIDKGWNGEQIDSADCPQEEEAMATGGNGPTWQSIKELYDSNDHSDSRLADAQAATILAERYSFLTVRESGAMYYYDDTSSLYVQKGESYARQLLREHLRGYMTQSRRNNILEELKAESMIEGDEFEPPEWKILTDNGVLDLHSFELEEFDSDYYFTSKVTCEFDPEAGFEDWEAFVRSSVDSKWKYRVLQEYAGYCLMPWTHKHHKNLFIVGMTGCGKSTFTEALELALFDSPQAKSNVDPMKIANGRFGSADLPEVMVNIKNDINGGKIHDSGTLKSIFSGEPMQFERKYQDPFYDRPLAKHIYTANWLPNVLGEDEAFFRRILIIEFPYQVNNEDRIKNYKHQLAENSSGILNWAIEGLERFEEQNGFSYEKSVTETRRLWTYWRNSPLLFINTNCKITKDESDWEERKAFYIAYREWCERHNLDIQQPESVTNLIRSNLGWVECRNVKNATIAAGAEKVADSTIPAYVGLRLVGE